MPVEASAAGASPGSLAAVGTALKAFVLVHPIGLSVAGGVLLGVGGYYAVARLLRKKEEPAEAEPTAA